MNAPKPLATLAEFSIRLTKRQTSLRDALVERFSGWPGATLSGGAGQYSSGRPGGGLGQVLESLLTGGEPVRLSPELCWHRRVQKGLDILRCCVLTTALSRWQRSGTLCDTTPEIRFAVFRSLHRRQITVREGDRCRLKLKFHD